MDTRIVNACFYPSRLPLLTCHIFIDLLLIDQQPICNYIGLTYKFNVQVTKPKSVVKYWAQDKLLNQLSNVIKKQPIY